MRDPVVRNLKITQAYHDLKIALAQILGSENVPWCAYATWASKTAGRFIRGELLPSLTREILDRASPFRDVMSHAGLLSALVDVHDEVAGHAAEGNRLVFAEMGPLYADFVARFSGERRRDGEEIRAFLGQLTPGPVERGGQGMLIEAFTHLHEAMLEQDDKARAELILLSNLLVGYHEQTRLQGPIAGAMSAPLRLLPLRGLLSGDAGSPSSWLLGRLAQGIERRWRELLTRQLMTLDLPSARLHLGEDLPPWSVDHDFPSALRRATHPRLVALLRELDLTPDTVAGSAARDWASLRDRMNFVVDFFRTRQQDPILFDQPFSYLQAAAIAEDRVPHGAL